jgi:flagellar motor switch protein FliN
VAGFAENKFLRESGMNKFIGSWLARAEEILGQELGVPVDLLPGGAISPTAASVSWMVDIAGDWEGTFTATADGEAIAALFGNAEPDADAGGERWERLFKRICIEAAALLGQESGRSCEVAMISPGDAAVDSHGMGYQLRAGERSMALVLADRIEAAASAVGEQPQWEPPKPASAPPRPDEVSAKATVAQAAEAARQAADAVARQGIELLLDIELEASLRFGSREMALSDLLALGPGDVVQLDRALTDPVDLIVGDKIVARGEVVLVNGNFGLQVTEVAEPRKSLESIRCLF